MWFGDVFLPSVSHLSDSVVTAHNSVKTSQNPGWDLSVHNPRIPHSEEKGFYKYFQPHFLGHDLFWLSNIPWSGQTMLNWVRKMVDARTQSWWDPEDKGCPNKNHHRNYWIFSIWQVIALHMDSFNQQLCTERTQHWSYKHSSGARGLLSKSQLPC